MDDLNVRTPWKRHDPDKGAFRAGCYDVSKFVTVYCRVLLVPIDGYFSGGASIRALRQSEVIGWRDIFYERSIPKRVIVPIEKKDERIMQGKASIIYNGSVTTSFNDSEKRKIKLMKKEISKLLKIAELGQREVTSNLKGTLQREFDETYLEMALESKKPVLYSNLELRLPLL